MPINAGYEYFNAEKVYLDAQTVEEKIEALEGMIRTAPKHKGSENLLSELKTRLKKLREKSEKIKKVGGGKKGLKKEGYQVVLVGFPSSGKSSLLSVLTNARPAISPYAFTTREPMVGTMDYEGAKAQIVDLPSLGGVDFDIGIANTADCVLLIIDCTNENFDFVGTLKKLNDRLIRSRGSRLVVLTKIDKLDSTQLRKLREQFRSRKMNGVLVSSVSSEGIDELKKKIFETMGVIRVYTKEPGKPRSPYPVVLPKNSKVRNVAESIRNGFSKTVKETRITGPSGKFANQKVGLEHVLKDRDVVEFHTF